MHSSAHSSVHLGAIGLALLLVVSLLTGSLLPTALADDAAPVTVVSPTTNSETTPLGIGGDDLRFGWQLASGSRGVAQSAYEIRVGKDGDSGYLWETGKVASDASVGVAYDGPALDSQTRYSWQVRVWDAQGRVSQWSASTWFETGILDASEWKADWIGGDDPAQEVAKWANYTVTVDYTLKPGTAFGIFLRGESTASAYMWQLNDEASGNPKLRPHKRINGAYSLLGEVPLTGSGLPATVLKERGRVAITVSGTTIQTRVNDVLVDTRNDASLARGFVGFRTTQSTTALESVVIHSVRVTDGASTLLDTSFTQGNPFSGGTVVEGGLELTGNHDVLYIPQVQQPLLRRSFEVEKEITSARVYASARGIYELNLNGHPVSDNKLAPGWTDYTKRIQYQTFDVTDLLATGENVFGGMLAPGWYAGKLAHIGDKNYGSRTSLIVQLRIDYADGTSELVTSDDSWRAAKGPWTQADLINGESYDARLALPGWDLPGFNDSAWAPVWVGPSATELLTPQTDPPVRETGQRPALKRTEPSPGAWTYDVGQNMVGVISVRLQGSAGETVRIRYAEELNPDGTVYTANLRGAKATDYYTFSADGEVTFEPTFTFHGFRYVEITGVSTPPAVSELTGKVWNSDLGFIGSLTTSSPMLNQLVSNIAWGQRGNFLSIPTDTPARDERMGWSGDINVFAPTAAYNMDSLNFLSKWLVDLQDAQRANGDYWGVAPYHPNLNCCGGGTGWSDAGITVPWTLWQSYGDTQHIKDGYASMLRYMSFLETSYPSMVRSDVGYGDWLNLSDPVPNDVLGTAYFAYVARLMSEMSAAIGETADATHFRELAERGAAIFAERFVAVDGTVKGDSQAGYALALGMRLVPEEARAKVADKFVAALARKDYHLSTGFLGTPWLVPALSESGRLDVAYRLLLNETYPSWGYEVAMGATTMWERWDSIRPDGSFGDVSMNSFNHYAYGAIGDWMYQNIGGISIGEPGYKHSLIAPKVGGGLTHASGRYESVYGTIATNWRFDGEDFLLDVSIPANTTATVVLPASSVWAVTESGEPAVGAESVSVGETTGETISLQVGSGSYRFRVHADLQATGLLIDAIDALLDGIDDQHDQRNLTNAQRDHLVQAVDAIKTDAQMALRAIEAGDRDAGRASLQGVREKLDVFEREASSAGLAEAPRETLSELALDVRLAAGQSVSDVTGVVTTLEVTSPLVAPGSNVQMTAKVTNGSAEPIDELSVSALSRDGWKISDPVLGAMSLAAGESTTATFLVTVPGDAKPGDLGSIAALTDFRQGDWLMQTAVRADAVVTSPVSVGDVISTPAVSGADQIVTLSVPVTNDGEVGVTLDATATLSGELAGGAGTVSSGSFFLAAGESATLKLAVPVPLTVTEQTIDVPIVVAQHAQPEDTVLANLTGTVTVKLASGQLDHVDLGDSASETAHNLTAHPASGTSAEAGLTRRYSHQAHAGSWFEFDVAAEPGKPLTVRAAETYGGAGTKEYNVYADGDLVHERLHTYAGSSAGTAEYSFTIPASKVGDSGTVRLRFEKGATAALGDPSIADVWVYSEEVTDHVDLGNSHSERQHALTAHSASATVPNEAGYTRRYSGINSPGSWYEFDLAVTPGEPFILQARETFDGPQTKDFYLSLIHI